MDQVTDYGTVRKKNNYLRRRKVSWYWNNNDTISKNSKIENTDRIDWQLINRLSRGTRWPIEEERDNLREEPGSLHKNHERPLETRRVRKKFNQNI